MTGQSQVQQAARTPDLYPSRVNTETLLLKRQDPVVYNHAIGQAEIRADQLASYEADGYLFLDSFFSEDEVQAWKRELVRLFQDYKGSAKPEVIREPGSEEIRSIFAVHREGIFQQLANHPRIIKIVEQILGSQVYVHQSRINFQARLYGQRVLLAFRLRDMACGRRHAPHEGIELLHCLGREQCEQRSINGHPRLAPHVRLLYRGHTGRPL